jgi:hypothetical protein
MQAVPVICSYLQVRIFIRALRLWSTPNFRHWINSVPYSYSNRNIGHRATVVTLKYTSVIMLYVVTFALHPWMYICFLSYVSRLLQARVSLTHEQKPYATVNKLEILIQTPARELLKATNKRLKHQAFFITSTCFNPKRVIIREYIRNYMKYQCCVALSADALNMLIVNILKKKLQQSMKHNIGILYNFWCIPGW